MKNLLSAIVGFVLIHSICLAESCEPGFTEVNGLCFHEGDLSVLQKFIDNSTASGVGDDCDPYDSYCGSPNPFMDSLDAWFWNIIDGVYYQSGTGNGFQNANGEVEPLELGLQEWENGRLTSLMCGAYIYCQLSGPIPEEVSQLTKLRVFRMEYNDLSGFVPDTICELEANYDDYLEFDLTGNMLCPPYPECIDTGYQNTTSCSEPGDVNYDGSINILDVITLVTYILSPESADYQDLMISDTNADGQLDILDVIDIINIILS